MKSKENMSAVSLGSSFQWTLPLATMPIAVNSIQGINIYVFLFYDLAKLHC